MQIAKSFHRGTQRSNHMETSNARVDPYDARKNRATSNSVQFQFGLRSLVWAVQCCRRSYWDAGDPILAHRVEANLSRTALRPQQAEHGAIHALLRSTSAAFEWTPYTYACD
jgi:hypothetical protein